MGLLWLPSGWESTLQYGRQGFDPGQSPWVGPGKPNLTLELRGKAGGCARVTAGPKRPHLGVCREPNSPLH